eukprot:7500612-Pyramimonas_sp.AAC.1
MYGGDSSSSRSGGGEVGRLALQRNGGWRGRWRINGQTGNCRASSPDLPPIPNWTPLGDWHAWRAAHTRPHAGVGPSMG